MAWTRKLSSGRYQGQYKDTSGKVRSVGSWERKGDAKKAADEEERRSKLADYVEPDHRKLPFGPWAEKQMASRLNITSSTASRDGYYFRSYVLPSFGDLPLGAIDHECLQDWLDDLSARGLAPRTVRHAGLLMNQLLKKAVRSKKLSSNPYTGLVLPRIEDTEQRFLSPAELELLAQETSPAFRPMIYTGGYLGARWGELAGLRRRDVNLLKQQLTISGTLQRDEKDRLHYVAATKTVAGRRTLSVPSFLVDILSEHLDSHSSEWLFPSRSGDHVRSYSSWMKTYWRPAVKRAGIDYCTPHALRHTCAAILIELGANPVTIQQRLGHKDVRTTLGTYGHLFPHQDAVLTEALSAARSEAVQRMCSQQQDIVSISRTS